MEGVLDAGTVESVGGGQQSIVGKQKKRNKCITRAKIIRGRQEVDDDMGERIEGDYKH